MLIQANNILTVKSLESRNLCTWVKARGLQRQREWGAEMTRIWLHRRDPISDDLVMDFIVLNTSLLILSPKSTIDLISNEC